MGQDPDQHLCLDSRAPIDRPISRESSASPNLVGDEQRIQCAITNAHSSATQLHSVFTISPQWQSSCCSLTERLSTAVVDRVTPPSPSALLTVTQHQCCSRPAAQWVGARQSYRYDYCGCTLAGCCTEPSAVWPSSDATAPLTCLSLLSSLL